MTPLRLDKHVLSEDEKKTQEYVVSNPSSFILIAYVLPQVRQAGIPLRFLRSDTVACRVLCLFFNL